MPSVYPGASDVFVDPAATDFSADVHKNEHSLLASAVTAIEGRTGTASGTFVDFSSPQNVTGPKKFAVGMLLDQGTLVIDAIALGAYGDTFNLSDAAIASGTRTLTSASISAADASKSIVVVGAGAAGADLFTTITSAGVGTATLAANAGTTVSGAWAVVGHDDTSVITGILASLPTSSVVNKTKLLLRGNHFINQMIQVQHASMELAGMGFGTGLVWGGTSGGPMMRLLDCWGSKVSRLALKGSGTSKPSAGISMYQDAGGVRNSFNSIDECLIGYWPSDSPVNHQGLTTGIVFEGSVNANDDMNYIGRTLFSGCDTGLWLSQSQNVGNLLKRLVFSGCGTGIRADADMLAVGLDFANCTSRDMDIGTAAAVHARCFGYTSEQSGEMARVQNAATLDVKGGYFQVSNSLNASGYIIESNDGGAVDVSLEDFDLSNLSYSGAGPSISLTTNSFVTKRLRLERITSAWTLNHPFINMITANGGGATDVRVFEGSIRSTGKRWRNVWSGASAGSFAHRIDTNRTDRGSGVPPAIAASGANATSPVVVGNSDDDDGAVTFTTAAGLAADASVVVVSFASGRDSAPVGVSLSPLNGASVAAQAFATAIATGSFTVALHAPPSGATAMSFCFSVVR